MQLIVAEDAPSVGKVLDKLQTVQISETGVMTHRRVIAAPDEDVLFSLLREPSLVLSSQETRAAEAFLHAKPAGGVVVLSAGSCLSVGGRLRSLFAKRELGADRVACFATRRWTADELAFVRQERVQAYTMLEISRESLSEMTDAVMMCARQWPCFHLIISLDVLDPAFAPGVAHPCAGGLSGRELLYVVQRLRLIKTLHSVEVRLDDAADSASALFTAQLLVELL